MLITRQPHRLRRRGPDTVRHYDPNQPRDDHGRWNGGGGSASAGGHVVKDIDSRMEKIIKGGKHIGESEQCVALVKDLAPEVGRAADWEEGERIKSYGDPPLERGTAIATFKNGRYQNRASGNHAAIFLEYGEKNGKRGIWVLDQSTDKKPQKSHKPFGRSAEYYSVIRRK